MRPGRRELRPVSPTRLNHSPRRVGQPVQQGLRPIASLVQRIRNRLSRNKPLEIDGFVIPAEKSQELARSATGDLEKLFYAHKGRTVHKWLHFLPAYEAAFSRYRGTDVRMLEIGVNQGGSLEMWRSYFGPAATIFGIDIDPSCAANVDAPNQVRIGSQTDEAFLRRVVDEMGTPDIILDDGSHVRPHQVETFRVLFPLLKEGGVYLIEDMHTSYWSRVYDGGYRKPGTMIELVKDIIDDMHAWYHDHPTTTPARDWIPAVHVYDSIAVIEKRRVSRPGHIRIG